MRYERIAAGMALVVAVQAPTAHYRHYHKHLLNDLHATPGAVDAHADTSVICVSGYTSQPGVRHVTESVKTAAYASYGAEHAGHPPKAPSCCEVDHLISLELGGSNDIKNLWPEPYPEATEKDKVENALHHLVCTGKISLGLAQRGIAKNWVRFRDSLVKAGNWVGKKEQNERE